MERDTKHISENEKRKNVLIYILIGILVIIFLAIVIMMIPKDNNNGNNVLNEKNNNKSSFIDDNDLNKNEEHVQRDKNKVTISVIPETLTDYGAVIEIIDTNENKYSWVPSYKLQQFVNGTWEYMVLRNPDNAIFADIAHDNPNGNMEQSLVWSNKYGKLESGKYRIVKMSDNTEFYAEFEIP